MTNVYINDQCIHVKTRMNCICNATGSVMLESCLFSLHFILSMTVACVQVSIRA